MNVIGKNNNLGNKFCNFCHRFNPISIGFSNLDRKYFCIICFFILLTSGFITSAIDIFSKKEKKSIRLMAIFIIFGLAIFWHSSVMYVGLNGYYDN